ncbi:MAG: NAD(P)/FAD-dependent oxidoreductase [Pseudomonadales bacterium]|nr:NAD(P)/FAD-dependent oxidoreductase [Pseudomonadales bacterium]
MSLVTEQFEVIVVGTGFSGLLCASYLKEAGIEKMLVLEMNSSVGGVWSHGGVGAYPGAACDVPAYSYLPFLDRTGFIPSKKYVSQQEIADYAEMLTDYCGIRDFIRFGRKVTEIHYVGEGDKVWEVTAVDPATNEVIEVLGCKHVVSANGPLSTPRLPEVPGMESFRGESFHTAKWDRSASLKGKKVGVIGTGASAAQVITAIADDVDELLVFQRTATWCLPRNDEPTPQELVDKFRAGGYSESLRYVDWKEEQPPEEPPLFTFEMLHDEEANQKICDQLAARIRHEVEDPELVRLLTPEYPFFCKRALFIDDYYTTFNKPNVHLIADPGGVVKVNETGVEIARGETFDVDVIIYATGFDSNLIPYHVVGRDGVTLADTYGATEESNYQMVRPQSLWGIHVEAMPNLYIMIGPQSLNPVTNVTLLCEEQSRYIAALVSRMNAEGKSVVEPTHDAVQNWTRLCNSTAEGKVWLRCNNWYLKTTKTDAAQGRDHSSGMWMESYAEYLKHVLGGKGGTQEELLSFA